MAEFVYTRVCHSHPEHQQLPGLRSVHAPNLDQAIVIVRRQMSHRAQHFRCPKCLGSIILTFTGDSGQPITVQSNR